MGVLRNLEGIAATEIEAVFIDKPSDITAILVAGKGATTAGDNGAINIWRDDEGYIRCQAMQWLKTVETKRYFTILGAEKWAAKWIQKIN